MFTSEQEQGVMSRVAKYFNIEPDTENGKFDKSTYDWVSGAYMSNREFLSLDRVVNFIEKEILGTDISDTSEIANAVADYFDLSSSDLDSYEFQAGSNLNGVWLNLANVVECIEDKILPDKYELEKMSSEKVEVKEELTFEVTAFYDEKLSGISDRATDLTFDEAVDTLHEYISKGGFVQVRCDDTGVDKVFDYDEYFDGFEGESPLFALYDDFKDGKNESIKTTFNKSDVKIEQNNKTQSKGEIK